MMDEDESTVAVAKKKSYQAKKNEGNDLFFRILKNILTTKSAKLYKEHVDDPTFNDVYTNVGIEKALMKCYDLNLVKSLILNQMNYCNITEKHQHYYYLMNTLIKTDKYIDWKNGI